MKLSVISLGIVALAWPLAGHPPSAATAMQEVADPPNIVLVLVDDARTDDMTTLPGVQQLVGSAGATFNGAVSPFPLCCPARATLLTGQYAHNHGVLGNKSPLGGWSTFRDSNTLATWLDPTYETGLIGKYLNEYKAPYVPPGWDYWAVPKWMFSYRWPAWTINGANKSLPGYQTDVVAQLASSFIRRSAAGSEPFFLYTSIIAPHDGEPAEADDPSMPTPNVADAYRDRFKGIALTHPAFNEADVSDKPVRLSPLTPEQIAAEKEVNAQRREALLSAQDALRTIVDALRDTGELGNTYVWFMSDNGYFMGEHRITWGKYAPYEVAVRVPMMLRGPGIPAGTVVSQPTSLVDFAPTVLAMAGLGAAPGQFPLDGVNLLPRIGDSSLGMARPLLIEAAPRDPAASPTDPYFFHGVIANLDSTQWKFVVRATGRRELYNITRDPYELTNVAGQAPYATVQSRMQALLNQYQWCVGAACRSEPTS